MILTSKNEILKQILPSLQHDSYDMSHEKSSLMPLFRDPSLGSASFL